MALNLMIVDNDHVNSFVLKNTILRTYPETNICLFQDGLEALTHLSEIQKKREEFPEVIILEMHLSDLNGFDFLSQYKDQFGHMPTVVFTMSNSFSKGDEQRANSFSFVHGYVTKSLINNNIQFIIGNYLKDGSDIYI